MKTKRSKPPSWMTCAIIFLIAAVGAAASVHAAEYHWSGGNSNWNEGENWINETVPEPGGEVHIEQEGATVSLDLDYLPGNALNYLSVGYGSTLLQDGYTLAVTGDTDIGYYGFGAYTMSGGAHSTGFLSIGAFGAGYYTNSGGSTEVASDLFLGYYFENVIGRYTLNGAGTLAAANEYIGFGGHGLFEQSGNTTNTVSGWLVMGDGAGSEGTYTLGISESPDMPVLCVNDTMVVGGSGTGTFIQNGGALWVGGNEYIGTDTSGSGTFDQYGGTHDVGGDLFIDMSALTKGTYNLYDGDLAVAGNTLIGNAGSALFNQYGGTNTVEKNLRIGEYAGSSGTYNLNGGTLNVNSGADNEGQYGYDAGYTVVGHNGTGEFNQESGSTFNAGVLVLGGGPYAGMDPVSSSGTYNMYGGTLYAAMIEIGRDDGKGIFNQSGGEVTTSVLNMGAYDYGDGEYTIGNDARLTVTDVMRVGFATMGQAVFTQQDSSVVDAATLSIDETGTYFMEGGELYASYIENFGAFQGSGEISPDAFANNGDLIVGNSIGSLTIEGNYYQGSDGILDIEIGGSAYFDTLYVTGEAHLGGTLSLSLVDDFAPAIGDAFDILAADSVFDNFISILGPAGYSWDATLVDLGEDGDFDLVRVTANAVPIPAAAWLFGSVLVGIVGLRRNC